MEKIGCRFATVQISQILFMSQCNWRVLSLRISALELTILDPSIGTGSLDSSSIQVVDLANEACVWLTVQGQRDHNLSCIRRQTETNHGLTMSYLQLTYFRTCYKFHRLKVKSWKVGIQQNSQTSHVFHQLSTKRLKKKKENTF